jgi:hypothetical protein
VPDTSINDALTVFAVGVVFMLTMRLLGGMLFGVYQTLRDFLGLGRGL